MSLRLVEDTHAHAHTPLLSAGSENCCVPLVCVFSFYWVRYMNKSCGRQMLGERCSCTAREEQRPRTFAVGKRGGRVGYKEMNALKVSGRGAVGEGTAFMGKSRAFHCHCSHHTREAMLLVPFRGSAVLVLRLWM